MPETSGRIGKWKFVTSDEDVSISRLRWIVWICRRVQTPSETDGGITETLHRLAQVHAEIKAIGALTFYGAAQTDSPVTHKIVMRWCDYLDQSTVILRQTRGANAQPRNEIFRVRRILEIGGRKRFVSIETELESSNLPINFVMHS